MRKILTIATILTAITAAANAAQMCVNIDISSCSGFGDYRNVRTEYDYTGSCGGTTIRIIGANGSATSTGTTNGFATSETILRDTNSGTVGCWCRIVSPYLSKWVRLFESTSDSCTGSCAQSIYGSFGTDFRYAIFSSENVIK